MDIMQQVTQIETSPLCMFLVCYFGRGVSPDVMRSDSPGTACAVGVSARALAPTPTEQLCDPARVSGRWFAAGELRRLDKSAFRSDEHSSAQSVFRGGLLGRLCLGDSFARPIRRIVRLGSRCGNRSVRGAVCATYCRNSNIRPIWSRRKD